MKLVFVIPSLGAGGAERVATILINFFVEHKGVEVDLVLINESVDFYKINNKINVYRLGYSNGGGKFFKFLNLLKALFKLRKILKHNKNSTVVSFIREANIFTLLSSSFLNLKIFISERDSPDVIVHPVYKFLRKILYPKATSIICQTSEYENFILSEVKARNSIVIPNPVRYVDINSQKKEKIILCVGRLIPSKNHIDILKMFQKIQDRTWKLVILGDGILRSNLEQAAEKLGISNRVEFLGSVKNVDYWLNKSSIFVSVSLSEGFPNSLLEAMAAGVPAVSYNCRCGPSDIIQDGVNGFLIVSGDLEALTIQVEKLMSSETLRKAISERALNVREFYSEKRISELYFNEFF